jgi:hypothetical protein
VAWTAGGVRVHSSSPAMVLRGSSSPATRDGEKGRAMRLSLTVP